MRAACRCCCFLLLLLLLSVLPLLPLILLLLSLQVVVAQITLGSDGARFGSGITAGVTEVSLGAQGRSTGGGPDWEAGPFTFSIP